MGFFEFLSVAAGIGLFITIAALIQQYMIERLRHGRGRQASETELQAMQNRLQDLETRIEVLEDIATEDTADLKQRLQELQEEKEMLRRLKT